MAKTLHNDVFDFGLDIINKTATKMVIMSGVPANSSNCTAASSALLAVTTMTTAAAGFYVIEDGSVSGRKLTIKARTALAVSTTGTADTICLISTGAAGKIFAVTSCTTQVLGSTSNTVTVPEWYITLSDPS